MRPYRHEVTKMCDQVSKTSAVSNPEKYKKVSDNKQSLLSSLANFTGTMQYFRHWMKFNYTDGVKFLAETGNCFWLLDAIGSYQYKVKNIPFQVWTLKVSEDKTAVLEMREDSNTPVIIKQEIPYTDFPLKEITLFYIDGVLLLTSEY